MSAKQEAARIFASGMILAGMSALSGNKPEDANAQLDYAKPNRPGIALDLKVPVPTPLELKSTELSPNPVTFTSKDGNSTIDWLRDNAQYGTPPNDRNQLTGSVDVSVNGIYSFTFQTKNSLYQELSNGTFYSTGIEWQLPDPSSDRFFLITGIPSIDGRTFYVRCEMGMDKYNPQDMSEGARKLIVAGLPQGGKRGSSPGNLLDFVTFGQDAKGRYLQGVAQGYINPEDNAIYRLYFETDNSFVKIPIYRNVLPIAMNKAPQP